MKIRFFFSIPVIVLLGSCQPEPVEPVEGLLAFTGFRLLDGRGGPPLEDAVMVVRDGRIESIGGAGEVEIPAGAQSIDLSGKIVTPGLIVTHGHVGLARGLETGPEVNTRENVIDQLRLYAKYGVTSVVSLGFDSDAGLGVSAEQENPGFDYARLFVAGTTIDTQDPQEALELVRQNHERGVDFIKLRVDDQLATTEKMSREVYEPAIEAAHDLGLKVTAHLYYLEDAKELLEAGVDFLAHSIRDLAVDPELIDLMNQNNVCLTPTLTRELSTFVYASEPSFFSDAYFTKAVDPAILEELRRPERQQSVADDRAANLYRQSLPTAMQNLTDLAEAGVRIAFGTDSGPPGRFQGYFEHLEMDMMVEAGLSPRQVFESATSNAAQCLGLEGLGTLETGNWADFLVLEEDPLADVKNFRTLEATWIAGTRILP